ncbi:MAG TPA: DUF4384 domain-containing protein [Pyrinomonadaceae bacterium]|jgi:hypothetical protein|nr:DUF4384 domain-containing protein [Pyrinomonadaceae bacterium]
MRCKLFSQLLLAALVLVVPAGAQQQGQQQQQPQPPQDEQIITRGAFLTTRPKAGNREGAQVSGGAGVAVTTTGTTSAPATVAANNPTKNSKRSVAKSPGKPLGKKTSATGESAVVKNENAGAVAKTPGVETVAATGEATKPRPLGLGYTFFTLGDNGLAVRTDSARHFRTGEAIRIALESNTDGYLYIFHTENDGEPSMIFPDTRLNGGANFVRAHVPYEIPSSEEASEAMRWFVFKDPPAAERLYIVLTRQPLAGVPTGEALAAYCFDAQHTCPWRPAAGVWTELKATHEREQVAVSKVKDQGRVQTTDEREAATRGLGLGAGAPTPSVIRMTASANSKVLVTAIDLIHK